LEEGVTALPDRVLDTVLDQLPATPQRRSWWPPRRFAQMNTSVKLAIAAAAVVVVAIVGIRLLPGPSVGPPVPTPVPTPTQAAAPAPTASPSATGVPTEFPEGPLPAGTYGILPFTSGNGICMDDFRQTGCTESPADDTIRVTLTVPTGWAGIGGTLWRAVEFNSPPGGAGLLFSRGPWLHSAERICQPGTGEPPDVSTGTTVAEFVDALVAHPALDVTAPVDVTLAGYSGKYLELQAPDNIATNQDNPAEGECAYYFVWEPGIYAQGPNHLWHIWVLDVAGTRVVVRSDTYPGTTPAVQAELSAIVNSIEIRP
jgi:hypothetical protein